MLRGAAECSGAGAPLFEQFLGRSAQIPDKPQLLKPAKDKVGQVKLPPVEPLALAGRIAVVVVVPSFAHGQNRQQPVVATGVGGLEGAVAKDVGQRVDGERAVVQ